MQPLDESHILIFLLQMFLLLFISRGLGELFRYFKQLPLTAEILTGVLLGPTVLGRLWPSAYHWIFPADVVQVNMLETISWLGVFFLLLVIGLEIDFASAWQQRGDAFKIAVSGVVLPLTGLFILNFLFLQDYVVIPDQRIIFSLFMATVMSITSMPIVTRALYDLSISKTELGYLIISALSINDILGWFVFTITLVLFTSGAVGIVQAVYVLMGAVVFIVLCLTIGRQWANRMLVTIKLMHMPEPSTSLTFVCVLGLLCGTVMQLIGINALFGFFIAGIMAGGGRALSERTRHVITQMVYAIFVPLFFATIGLKVDFWTNFDWFIILYITFFSILGKFLGAGFGAMFTKVTQADGLSIAVAHIPGGVMEIVIGILALQNHLITERIFVGIIFAAVFSATVLGPWLKYTISRRKAISVLEYFSRTGVVCGLKATAPSMAIAELCELASLQGQMPSADQLFEAVLARENTMGTGLENSVAVPHARLPLLQRSRVVLGRSIGGIEWDSPDGKPVHFIFLILTPESENDVQVQILRAIAKVMNKNDIREKFIQAKESDDIWRIVQAAFTPESIVRDLSKI